MAEAEAARRALIVEQDKRRETERVLREAALQAELAQQEIARRAHQEAQKAEREAARQMKLAKQEAARRARQAQQEARKVEVEKEEAAKTEQRIVLGSTVTFGTGLAIQYTISGFESCRVRVKNLPMDAKESEVGALLTQQGIDPRSFHIVGMKKAPQGRQEATIVAEAEIGKLIVIGLDGTDFRQETLALEISEHGSVDSMGASARWSSNVLTVSWWAPAIRFVAEYNDIQQAEAKVRELNGNMCGGRRVKVEMNTAPPGRVTMALRPNAVKISGLPLSVTDADVAVFSGSTLLRRLKSTEYDLNLALRLLRLHIESNANGGLKAFETACTETAIDGNITVRASFNSWDQAKKVHDSLVNQRFAYIANSIFRLWLPDPFQYTITIPAEQFKAQKKQWDSLIEGTKGDKACNLRINVQDRVSIRVLGKDKKAVGSLKVRVENLAAGEKLENWHRSFGYGTGTQFLNSVSKATGAFVRNDWRLRALKVYGEPSAIREACEMIESEISRLASLEWTIFLKRQSIRFFVRHGLSALKETFGEDNVTLNISSSPCKVTVRGGEDARHALDRLIEESLGDLTMNQSTGSGAKCPICYDDVSSPVQLACGHIYCTACICHFLTTASDTKILPLSCMGDEAKCGVPVPIPTIRKFLTPQQFNHLLEVAFISHLEHHPQEFKYCPTPDCSQIYRCNSSTSLVLHCPSCFSAVCSSCHEEAHEGMSCADRKLHNDPAEQERLNEQWAMQQGIKRCPSCNVWIEKLEGCNHMACKCGAHICWKCMGTFNKDDIYDHMNAIHGGIGLEPAAVADEQEELHVPVIPQHLMYGQPYRELEGRRWQEEINAAHRREVQRREVLRREAQRREEEEERRRQQALAQYRMQQREEAARRQEQAQQQRQGRCIIM